MGISICVNPYPGIRTTKKLSMILIGLFVSIIKEHSLAGGKGKYSKQLQRVKGVD